MIDDYLIQLIVQFVTKSKNVGDPREEMRSSLSLSLCFLAWLMIIHYNMWSCFYITLFSLKKICSQIYSTQSHTHTYIYIYIYSLKCFLSLSLSLPPRKNCAQHSYRHYYGLTLLSLVSQKQKTLLSVNIFEIDICLTINEKLMLSNMKNYI